MTKRKIKSDHLSFLFIFTPGFLKTFVGLRSAETRLAEGQLAGGAKVGYGPSRNTNDSFKGRRATFSATKTFIKTAAG